MVDFERDFPQLAPVGQSVAGGRIKVAFADPERHRVEITLLVPLDIEGERVETLTVRRLTAGEMLVIVEAPDAPGDDADLTRHVVAAMIGWPAEVLEALSPDDAGRVAAAAIPFMPAGLVAALERTLAQQEATDDAA